MSDPRIRRLERLAAEGDRDAYDELLIELYRNGELERRSQEGDHEARDMLHYARLAVGEKSNYSVRAYTLIDQIRDGTAPPYLEWATEFSQNDFRDAFDPENTDMRSALSGRFLIVERGVVHSYDELWFHTVDTHEDLLRYLENRTYMLDWPNPAPWYPIGIVDLLFMEPLDYKTCVEVVGLRGKRYGPHCGRYRIYSPTEQEHFGITASVQNNPARSDFHAFQAQELLEEVRLNRDFLDTIFELNQSRTLTPYAIAVIRKRMNRQADQVLELDPEDHRLQISAGSLREIPDFIERGSGMDLEIALDDSEAGLRTFIGTWPPRGYRRPRKNPIDDFEEFDYYHGTTKWKLPKIRERGLVYPFLGSETSESWCWGGHYSTDPKTRRLLGVEVPDPDLLVPDYNLMDPYERYWVLGVAPEEYFDVRSVFGTPEGDAWLIEGAKKYGKRYVDDYECGGVASIYLGTIPWKNIQVVRRARENPNKGDERLRELERAAQTGSIEDRRHYVDELLRRGILEEGDRVPGPFWSPHQFADPAYTYLHTSYYPAEQERFTGRIWRSFYDFYHYPGMDKGARSWDQDLIARYGDREGSYSSNDLYFLRESAGASALSPLGREKRRIALELLGPQSE